MAGHMKGASTSSARATCANGLSTALKPIQETTPHFRHALLVWGAALDWLGRELDAYADRFDARAEESIRRSDCRLAAAHGARRRRNDTAWRSNIPGRE